MSDLQVLLEELFKTYELNGMEATLDVAFDLAPKTQESLLEEIAAVTEQSTEITQKVSHLASAPTEILFVLGIALAEYHDNKERLCEFLQGFSCLMYDEGDGTAAINYLVMALNTQRHKPRESWRLPHVSQEIGFLVRQVAVEYDEKKMWEEAIVFYEVAAAIMPTDRIVWCNLGGLLDKLDRVEEAKNVLERAVKVDPNDQIANYNLGLNLFNFEDFIGARKYLEEALRINPEYARAASKLGETLSIMGEVEKAVSILQDINKNHLSDREKYVFEALLEKIHSDPENIKPHNPEWFTKRSLELLGRSDYMNLKVHFDSLDSDKQETVLASLVFRAFEWLDIGRIQPTQQLIEFIDGIIIKWGQHYPFLWLYWQIKGDLYAAQRNALSAIECYDRALDLNNEIPDTIHRKAMALFSLKDRLALEQLHYQVSKSTSLSSEAEFINELLKSHGTFPDRYVDNFLSVDIPFETEIDNQKKESWNLEGIMSQKETYLLTQLNGQRSYHLSPSELSWLYLSLGVIRSAKGMYDLAYNDFSSALDLFQHCEDTNGSVLAKVKKIEALIELWRIDRASILTDETIKDIGKRIKEDDLTLTVIIEALIIQSSVYCALNPSVAIEFSTLAIKKAEQIKNQKLALRARTIFAAASFEIGDKIRAENEYRGVIRDGDELGYAWETLTAIVQWMERLSEMEHWDEVEQYGEIVNNRLGEESTLPLALRAQYCLALFYLSSKQDTKCAEILSSLNKKYQKKVMESVSWHGAWALIRNNRPASCVAVDLYLSLGKYSEALDLLESGRAGWVAYGKYLSSERVDHLLKLRMNHLDKLVHNRNNIITSSLLDFRNNDEPNTDGILHEVEIEIMNTTTDVDILSGNYRIENFPIRVSKAVQYLRRFGENWNLLVFWLGKDRQGVFVVSPSLEIRFVDVPAPDLMKEWDYFTRPRYTDYSKPRIVEHASCLEFIRDVTDRLPCDVMQANHIFIVPSGPLFVLPIHDIIRSRCGIERKDLSFSYLPDLSSIYRWIRRKYDTSEMTALIVDNPTVGVNSSQLDSETDLLKDLVSLEVLDQEMALKGTVRQALGKHNFVHFNCHGYVADEKLHSGLILSDGILTVDEILHEKLDLDLVCLSACNSGHLVATVADDIVGLTQAFLIAGASSVICTLSKVTTHNARIVMKEFYKLWLREGFSKATALAHAQAHLESLDKASKDTIANFVLYGSPE